MNPQEDDLTKIDESDIDEEGQIETDDHTEEDNEGAEELCDINAVLGGLNSTFEWSIKLPVKNFKTRNIVVKRQKFVLKVPPGKEYEKMRRFCKNKGVKYSNKFISEVVIAPKMDMDVIKRLPEPTKILIMDAIATRCGYTKDSEEMLNDFL